MPRGKIKRKPNLNRYRNNSRLTGKDVDEFLGTMEFLGTAIGTMLNNIATPKPKNDIIDIDYEEIKPDQLPKGK